MSSNPINPLRPVRPDPEYQTPRRPPSARKTLHRALIPMTIGMAAAVYLGSAPLVIAGVVVWLFWIARYVLLTQVLDPHGDSTPSVNQHSDIAAMAMLGDFAKAAEAYKAVIRADPADLVACDHLARLALRDMKDYELALFAYREAERRVSDPRRKVGYALHVVGIYRDQIKDADRTIVELRRLLARYPDAPNAAALRAELEQLQGHA